MAKANFESINKKISQLSENEKKGVERFLQGEVFECSTSIGGELTFGYGELDDFGFWEFSIPKEFIEFFP